MTIFHDRRDGSISEYPRGSAEYLDRLYGSGEEGMTHLFPGEQSDALTPWPSAGGIKRRFPYERGKVQAALSDPRGRLSDIDPRNLRSTQPSITRAGVDYYRSPSYRETGETFADKENPGNRFPMVYSRTHPVTGRVDHLLLSGHHRATAALLGGQFLRARHVEGGFEEERP